MILPKKMCEQISYFTTTSLTFNGAIWDRTVIHFNQWWKRKKTIDIKRRVANEDGEYSFYATEDYLELIDQLQQVMASTWGEPTTREDNVYYVDFGTKEKK